MTPLTLLEMQSRQPWTVPYSQGLQKAVGLNLMPHALSAHAVLHAVKSAGKLAGVFEGLDHAGGDPSPEQVQVIKDMAADLATAALRLANLHGFRLDEELERRVLEKNGVGFRQSEDV